MQARNRHEVTRASGAHCLPVGAGDFVLRADCERRHDAAMRRAREHGVDAPAQRRAPAIHAHADAARIHP